MNSMPFLVSRFSLKQSMRELEMHWLLAAYSARAKSNTMDWMASVSRPAYSKDSDSQGLQDEAGQGSLYSRPILPPTNTLRGEARNKGYMLGLQKAG